MFGNLFVRFGEFCFHLSNTYVYWVSGLAEREANLILWVNRPMHFVFMVMICVDNRQRRNYFEPTIVVFRQEIPRGNNHQMLSPEVSTGGRNQIAPTIVPVRQEIPRGNDRQMLSPEVRIGG